METHKRIQYSLFTIYEKIESHFGDLKWWPGDSVFEIAIGAILTQNTSWTNVEYAIQRLKNRNMLNPESLHAADNKYIAEAIRPSGCYNVKASRVKAFVEFVYREYKGNIEAVFGEDLWVLRKKLLSIRGIGEETADSILLYGAKKPIFVVDAYTKRILERGGIIKKGLAYHEIQQLFMLHLPHDISFFNQYHALLVNTGKYFCKKTKPYCEACPLRELRCHDIS